jgi:hypothetical protein
MTTDTIALGDNADLPLPTPAEQLAELKRRADQMGVHYHPNIGIEKLSEKIAARLADKPDPDQVPAAVPGSVAMGAGSQAAALDTSGEFIPPAETPQQKKRRKQLEASALVRVRITCMNPAKKEWDGEIFTVGNSVVGTFKKFVPFNGADDGYHIPQIMLEMLRAKECQIFVDQKTAKGKIRQGKLIKEFAIEVLPPLTEEEIHDLAQRQAMANSVG